MKQFDIFISHTKEDKDSFVRPLAKKLIKNGIEVWYDEFALKPGDSLRGSIDHGLANSRFGLVILSPSFFGKKWTQWELDGLVSRQMHESSSVIIPIWHDVNTSFVQSYSPSLANIISINSNIGISDIAKSIVKIVHPKGSILVTAKDILLQYNYKTPVVSDNWWLKVVEASITIYGSTNYRVYKGTWRFPLPPKKKSVYSNALRLAWTALHMNWLQYIKKNKINKLTHPKIVLEFINNMPGLQEICTRFPLILAQSSPLLVIKGYGGPFEKSFDSLLSESIGWYKGLENRNENEEHYQHLVDPYEVKKSWQLPWEELAQKIAIKPEIIIDKNGKCSGPCVLRHPTPKRINPTYATESFQVLDYIDNIDCVAWLLSSNSDWLPKELHDLLTSALWGWGAWTWGKENKKSSYKEVYHMRGRRKSNISKSVSNKFLTPGITGSLKDALWVTKTFSSFQLTEDMNQDIIERLSLSVYVLELPEAPSELTNNFLNSGIIESYIATRTKIRQSVDSMNLGKHSLKSLEPIEFFKN